MDNEHTDHIDDEHKDLTILVAAIKVMDVLHPMNDIMEMMDLGGRNDLKADMLRMASEQIDFATKIIESIRDGDGPLAKPDNSRKIMITLKTLTMQKEMMELRYGVESDGIDLGDIPGLDDFG